LTNERTRYVTNAESVLIHVVAMGYFGEPRFGADNRALIESAITSEFYTGSRVSRRVSGGCVKGSFHVVK
jgi:hypothetical protein